MPNIKFSIVTCTRNSMVTLRETVASVRSQTFIDWEHIFVDGSSTDGTLEYLNALDGNVRVLAGVGGGISRAMNEGIAAAKGEIVCHLHSDDYFLHPRVLQRVAAAFEARKAGWLFGRIVSDVDGGLFPERYKIPRYTYEKLLGSNFIPHPATFVRRELFDEVGSFDEQLRYAMDYDLLLRLARHSDPIQLDEALTVFRRHEASATQSNWLASYDEQYAVRCRHVAPSSPRGLWHALRYRYWRARILHSQRRAARPR